MILIAAACAAMLLLTASTHFETLALLNAMLPRLCMPRRLKVLVVLVAVFAAHVLEMALYALAYRGFGGVAHVGSLSGGASASFAACLYFSAETFTSLGFGDVTPVGPLRLLAGMETLNGLLLVGWSASYIHLCMDRFWTDESIPAGPPTAPSPPR